MHHDRNAKLLIGPNWLVFIECKIFE